jgi:hypothetical protein
MKKNIFVFLIASIVLAGCSGLTVVADFDPSVDFNQYKTFEYYGWIEESDRVLNDLDRRRIESAFGAEFEARGLKYVEEGGDMVVGLFILAEQKTQTTAQTTQMGGGYGGGYGGYYGHGPGWGWGGGHSTTTYSEYDYVEGTLVCDIYDKAKEQLVWEGVGKGTINDNPQKREQSIPEAVKKIMAKYPVQPIGQ